MSRALTSSLVAIVIGALAPAMGSQAIAADESLLRLSVAVGPAHTLGRAAETWARHLAAADPSLAVRVHFAATLAGRDPAREWHALKEGGADLAVGSALQWSAQMPALAVFALPWMAPDARVLIALTSDVALRETLSARVRAAGIELVEVAPLGHRQIAIVERAVRGPDDLRGLRIRATSSPLVHELLLALGALPRGMAFREVQSAIARGALDGQEGPASVLAVARGSAIGYRHVTEWGAIADAMLFAVRKPAWDALSASQQAALRAAAADAIAEIDALGGEAAAIARLVREGVAVVRITPAGHEAFRNTTRSVVERWREAIGADVVAMAERAREAAGRPNRRRRRAGTIRRRRARGGRPFRRAWADASA